MNKKIFSLLAVLLVAATAFATFVIVKSNGTLITAVSDKLSFEQNGSSFTVNGIDVKDIAHIYNKDWDKYDDYERAFTQGYLDSKYYTYDRKKQITSQEFKAMLKTIVEKLRPDSMTYFNSRISDADEPITRGLAVAMAFYTARCIDAVQSNLVDGHTDASDFWNDIWTDNLQQILPFAQTAMAGDENGWQEMIYAVLWNDSHISYYSDKEVVAFNEGDYLWSWGLAFTWEEAVRAITRLYDGRASEEPKIVFAAIDSPDVTKADPSIITPELIEHARQREIHQISDLPRLYGFLYRGTKSQMKVDEYKTEINGRDVQEYAEWGFNTLKYQLSYWKLFSDDVEKANLNMLRAIDELIAAAMQNDMHFVLSLSDIPGKGCWLQTNPQLPYNVDIDILNPEKREKAKKVWSTLATRYKDVPNVSLSFTPLEDLSVLIDPSPYGYADLSFTNEQVADFTDILFDAIREVSPERFIFYDDIYGSNSYWVEDYFNITQKYYQHITEKYSNTRPVFNQMDMAYGFYGANQGDGNIDYASHSAWVPHYPIYQYAAQRQIGGKHNQLSFDGCLPAGTKLELHLESTDNAQLSITADGKELYNETFTGQQNYEVGFGSCYGEPFKPSNKIIPVTLSEKAEKIIISSGNGSFIWSGINVTLPESYAVERWRMDSEWDVQTGILAYEDYHHGFYKKSTSTIQIGATWWDDDDHATNLTIHDDVTFTSDTTWTYSDAKLYESYCKKFSGLTPRWSCRMESILRTDQASVMRYFDDMMSIFQNQNVDVWTQPCDDMIKEHPFYGDRHVAGFEGEKFGRRSKFNVKLLRVLQKYQDK